jgi:hypothetical protein
MRTVKFRCGNWQEEDPPTDGLGCTDSGCVVCRRLRGVLISFDLSNDEVRAEGRQAVEHLRGSGGEGSDDNQ